MNTHFSGPKPDNETKQDRFIHSVFEITILLKAVNGCWETIAGIVFLIFNRDIFYRALIFASNYSVAGSGHIAGNYLARQANNFSSNTKYFIALYLLFYGLINIFLAISLLKGRLWAYPLAVVFYIIFIFYQIYRLWLHQSGLLLILTLFDVVLVWVTILEYKRLKNTSATVV